MLVLLDETHERTCQDSIDSYMCFSVNDAPGLDDVFDVQEEMGPVEYLPMDASATTHHANDDLSN